MIIENDCHNYYNYLIVNIQNYLIDINSIIPSTNMSSVCIILSAVTSLQKNVVMN